MCLFARLNPDEHVNLGCAICVMRDSSTCTARREDQGPHANGPLAMEAGEATHEAPVTWQYLW